MGARPRRRAARVTERGPSRLLLAAMIAGFAFLYVPIVTMVAYSFNESELVTVWTGFSVRWYGVLLRDDEMLRAARLSVEIALLAATGATVVGTLAGYVLARFRRFRGRVLFAGMIAAPLVMPEIVTGIALLLMYVGSETLFGWPHGRGVATVTLSHVTFGAAFVAIIVQSRLAGTDMSVEEAAADLGARPVPLFFLITVPLLAPALVASWLLAFALSMDDVVISEFTTGPTSTTLPLVIFSAIRHGVKPEVNAFATLLIAVVVIATAGMTVLRRNARAR